MLIFLLLAPEEHFDLQTLIVASERKKVMEKTHPEIGQVIEL